MSMRGRGILLLRRLPPASWRGGPPLAPVRRCSCGAPIVALSVRFARCARGCTHLPPRPPRPAPKPAPLPSPAHDRYVRLRGELRALERDFVRQACKGRRPPASVVGLALAAVESLKRDYPDRAAEIVAALPWLEKQRARRAA